MTFEEYCIKKKIDPENFRKNEPDKWSSFSRIFDQVSENSFTQQKKFLLNDLRKSYPYIEKEKEIGVSSVESESKPVSSRPKIKPNIVKKEKESGDQSLESGEEKKSVNKPASAKPKIKPIIKPVVKKEEERSMEGGEEKKAASVKPKIKPIIKPVAKKEDNDKENKEKPTSGVSNTAKPIIKPLIKLKK